jgi:hypothetical protein
MSISKLNSSLMMKEISFGMENSISPRKKSIRKQKIIESKKSTGMNRLFSQRSMELSFPSVFEKL